MPLALVERYVLLATDPESGRILSYSLPYGIAAALLAQLAEHGRVEIEDGRVSVQSTAPCGEPLLDETLAILASARPARRIENLLPAIGGLHDLSKRVFEHLVTAGVMRYASHHALGIIPYHRYEVADANARAEVASRLREVFAGEGEHPREWKALAAVVAATGPVPHGCEEQAQKLVGSDQLAIGIRRAIDNDAAAAAMVIMTATG